MRDPVAHVYTYQDDMEVVCIPAAVAPVRLSFKQAASLAGLRSNASKDRLACGRGLCPADLPISGIRIEERPVVLKHAGPLPLPIRQDCNAAEGSILRPGSAETVALVTARRRLFTRLQEQRRAGLGDQIVLALAQARTSGDCTFVARTCGIPPADAKFLDGILAEFVLPFLGEGPQPATTSRVFLPTRSYGLGFSSVSVTAPAALAASWHATLPHILHLLDLGSPAGLEQLSPIANVFIPQAQQVLRDNDEDSSVCIGDTSLAITQRSIASASIAAAAQSVLDQATEEVSLSASIRSSGGPGAGSWLRAPIRPCHRLLQKQLQIGLRTRLHLDIPSQCGTCQHRRPDGSCCGASFGQQQHPCSQLCHRRLVGTMA